MIVYITKRNNGKYNYLLNWRNPENGVMFGEWFETMKELKEYISDWGATIEKINFLAVQKGEDMAEYRYMYGKGITGIQLLNSEHPVKNELIDPNEVRQKLITENMVLVRTARRKGYISRKIPGVVMCYYNGRFGEGYTVFQSAEDSSRYVTVSYYVSRETYERG